MNIQTFSHAMKISLCFTSLESPVTERKHLDHFFTLSLFFIKLFMEHEYLYFIFLVRLYSIIGSEY